MLCHTDQITTIHTTTFHFKLNWNSYILKKLYNEQLHIGTDIYWNSPKPMIRPEIATNETISIGFKN